MLKTIQRKKLKSKKYPETLNNLSNYSNLLLDPYTEKPFLYKKIKDKSYPL